MNEWMNEVCNDWIRDWTFAICIGGRLCKPKEINKHIIVLGFVNLYFHMKKDTSPESWNGLRLQNSIHRELISLYKDKEVKITLYKES